ncbi:unnamed protein product [Rotaria magnacalcarata]|uniref:Uncharacterized protein n=1 Tax=Rotaria magnacalcarata TaxID=392030 RepID=A0A815K5X2_9BILA|nr:unnamed protein product [Rotaria magnacalcarata]
MTTLNVDDIVDNIHDGQSHCYSQVSPKQIPLGQEILLKQQEQEMTLLPRKKKKNRGKRSEQHFRRRLHRKNFDDATIALLIEKRRENHRININNATQSKEQNTTNDDLNIFNNEHIEEWPLNDHINDNNILKRKRHTSIADHDNKIIKSLSQLSITRKNKNKNKTNNIENRNSASTSKKQNNQQRHEPTASTLSHLLPRYLTVSDCTFKHILSNTIENANLIVSWLDTQQKLQSTRQLAHTINMLQYFNLQQSLWQAYYSVGMKEDGWTTHISRYTAKEHATCTTYGRSRKFVEQRLATITNQLKRATKELQEISAKLPQWTDQAQPSINSKTLYFAIDELVNKNQKYLREEFKYKEMMLKFDVNDHRLITKVYNLKPNEKQV